MSQLAAREATRLALPGVALAASLGLVSMVVADRLSAHVIVPEVFVALVLGALIVNTPLGRLLGLGRQGETDAYSKGLTFVSKTLLRLSVVFMGLRIQTLAFGTSEIVTILVSLGVAIPCTFFITHALAYPLGIPTRLADMIAAGTMICGASAVNAVAPVVGAKKEDQGIALGTVFLFSAVAMVGFRPVAQAFGLSAEHGGLWSGLAVNDLASAVAVGAQMGPGGAEMAAASKSARIVMLAPVLVAFAFARGTTEQRQKARKSAAGHFPPFVAGFVILAVARMVIDMLAGGASWWKVVLDADRTVVSLAMAMVSLSIGLHLRLSALLSAGARAVALGAVAASTMAGLNLALLLLAAKGDYQPLLMSGLVALLSAYVLYRLARFAEASERRRSYANDGGIPQPRARTLTGSVRLASATGEFPAARS